jgi:CheY-like chemotaxis protein
MRAERLEEVDRMKSRFFANISHEFRTPLTLIKGPVKQIIDGTFAGNLIEQCKMILQNSDRLFRLINQILDLSKLESGQMKLQVLQSDILQFLKVLILSFCPLADRKKITLKFESLIGYIDRDKIEKTVTNLLSNAFKFTPEQGNIDVSLRMSNAKVPMPNEIQNPNVKQIPNSQFPIPKSDFIEISISNTGPGIPPDQLDKIFDRFYQADTTYKKDSEGSGIGLALTKELVELHYGAISVSCKKNSIRQDFLTNFTVQIPISKEYFKNEEIIEESSSLIPDPGYRISTSISDIEQLVMNSNNREPSTKEQVSSKRSPVSGVQPPIVLVVEDNPNVTTYIRSFLDHDYQIFTAENGKEGWKQALAKYPDLIISDVMMPEMDGFELCEKLKTDQRTSHIPVILLTAKADLNSKIEGLEFGADDYISKPFEAEELKVRAKNLIEQREQLREKFGKQIEVNLGEIATSSMDEQFLNRLLTVFEKHLSDPGYSTESFAREVGFSSSQLNRKLRALTNLSIHSFILNLRLKRAAQLLKNRTATVSEIAYSVGFKNPSKFASAFKHQYGSSPTDFSAKQKD